MAVAISVALVGCDQGRTTPDLAVPECPVNTALIRPWNPRLRIGDTLTMQRTWGPARYCWPPDTTAAGVRWWTPDQVAAIDSLTGRLTALRPGGGLIYLSQVGVRDAALGSTSVNVFEPLGADSVVTITHNHTEASAWVVLEDASGGVQRSQAVGARDSACWVTPLSDSLRYSVTIRPPPPPAGSDSTMTQWVTHSALAFNHTWWIVVDSATVHSVRTVTVGLFAPSTDPGRGC